MPSSGEGRLALSPPVLVKEDSGIPHYKRDGIDCPKTRKRWVTTVKVHAGLSAMQKS